jgi:glycine cleavage system H lipoate-binding protein
VPAGVLLHPTHTWAILDPAGTLRLGVDQLVLGALGGVDRIQVHQGKVRRGDPLITLWRQGKSLTLPSPVSGRVLGINPAAAATPERLAERLYEEDGWIVGVEPERLDEEFAPFRVARQAAQWIGSELRRLRELVVQGGLQPLPSGAPMADGGELAEGFLAAMDGEAWERFRSVFLRS